MVSLGATWDSFPGRMRRGTCLGEGKRRREGKDGDLSGRPTCGAATSLLVSGLVTVPFLCGSSPFF